MRLALRLKRSLTRSVRLLQRALVIFGTPEPEIDSETGEAGEALPRNDYEAEDLLAHAAGFEALGVILARSEAYRVMLACKQLDEDPDVKAATVRFFGKFFGRAGYYYVFEVTLKEAPKGGAAEGNTPTEEWDGCQHLSLLRLSDAR